MAEFRQHHSQSELDGTIERPMMLSGPPVQFHKSPALSRMSNHKAESKLPQVVKPIQKRLTQPPMNVSDALFDSLPQQPTSSNYVLSGAHSLTANTKRGADSIMAAQQQQSSPTQLGDYFQKMQAQWSMGGSQELVGVPLGEGAGGQLYMGTQQPRIGGQNRANSQAVRGTKGRNIGATTNILMQVRDKVQEQRDKALLAGQRTPGEMNESLSHHSNGSVPRLNSNMGSVASINNMREREEVNLEQIKTPLKNVKSRLNRNRTTENQNSRGQASNSLVNRRAVLDQFATPDVIGGRVTAALQSKLTQESGGEVKLRNFNQRITGKHKLQPINLQSKISTESFKKPSIHSGSYVVEMLNPNDVLLQPKQIKTNGNNQARSVPSQQTQNSYMRVNKSRQSNPARDHGTVQNYTHAPNGFKSNQSGKIPLLNKDHKRSQLRNQKPKVADSAQNIREQQIKESRTPEIEQTSTKDELMVTFFDKSLVPKRMSQEQVIRKDQILDPNDRQGSQQFLMRDEDSNHDQQRFQQLDQIARSVFDDRRHSTQSDGQMSRNGGFNEVVLKGGKEAKIDVQNSQSVMFKQAAPIQQHQSQKNLSSLSTIKSRDRNKEHPVMDQKLNGSMIVASSKIGSENLINLRNMNPTNGLYTNAEGKRRRSKKPSVSLQRGQPLSSSGGQFFDQMQSLVLHSQDSIPQQMMMHESSLLSNTLNRSMLVQECDLSQAGVSSVGAVDLVNDDSEYNSILSLSKKKQRKEPQQSSSHQMSVQIGDHSQMTKTYNLRSKMNTKSKVNMKQFIVNKQKKTLTPNRMVNSQLADLDRASQRSIVESTNAYIMAAQHQQEQNNRMQYLQSAGTIPSSYQHGNGLTEADIGGPSRYESVASSSVPYRTTLANKHLIPQKMNNNAVIAHQSHQHFPLPLHMHQSGRMLEPLAQYSLHQQLKNPPTEDSMRPQRDTQYDLDPDIALYQLRQDVLAPHPKFEMKSRQSQLSNNSMNLPQVSGATNLSRMNHQQSNNQYQTIAQQQSEVSSKLKMSLENTAQSQSNILFSAEKTRFELQNQQNLYLKQLDQSSFSGAPTNPNNAFNLATLNNMEGGNLRMQPVGVRQKSSNNVRSNESAYQNNEENNENPFKKGPKLHLFKKSRRLKTSSAARQFSEDDDEPHTTDVQTITTGIANHNSSLCMGLEEIRNSNKPNNKTDGIETSNTTIHASQQSFVYSTIEQISQNEKMMGIKTKKKQKESNLASVQSNDIRDEEEVEPMAQQMSRADMIASAASSYMAAMRVQQRQESEDSLRPLTSAFHSNEPENVAPINAYQDASKGPQTQMFEGLEIAGSVAKPPHSGSSKRSNASSLNTDHNATGTFDVVPATDIGSGYAMNGSRHSFYGIQTVGQQTKTDSAVVPDGISPKQAVKSSIILKDARSSAPASKKSGITFTSQESQKHKFTQENKGAIRNGKPILRNKISNTNNKQKQKQKNQEKVMKGVDLNQTFSNVKIEENSPDARVQLHSRSSVANIAKADSSLAQQLGSKKINSDQRSEYTAGSPQTAYNSRKKPHLEGSNEGLARNDSAKTPYFVPTPQRTTGSNWGDQTYQQHSGSQQSALGNKKSIKVEQAIQSLRTGEALRQGFLNNPATSFIIAAAGDLHNSANIKIEIQRSKGANGTKSRQSAISPAINESDPSQQSQLQEALSSQVSFDDQRKKLQSQNKTYRGTTAQKALVGGVGGRKNYTNQQIPRKNLHL